MKNTKEYFEEHRCVGDCRYGTEEDFGLVATPELFKYASLPQ